jgi:hypothetical protein
MNEFDTAITNVTDLTSKGIAQAETVAQQAGEEAKSLIGQAHDMFDQAVEVAANFIEERPIAAAAVAGGVALAAAGAVFGVSRLTSDEPATPPAAKAAGKDAPKKA